MNGVYWMEYISQKYPNLTSAVVPCIPMLKIEINLDIVENYVKNALRNWTQLKKFDMQQVFLSTEILQVMDDCNTCLEDLAVHITNEKDTEQFINLTHSKQGKRINELTIYDHTRSQSGERNQNLPNQEHLVRFMQSLNTNSCRLKTLDVGMNKSGFGSCSPHLNIITPIQLLNCAPSSVQKLSMHWVGAKNGTRTTYRQTNHPTHLDLKLCQADDNREWERNTERHVQDIVNGSPLLESFSLSTFLEKHPLTLDLQRNTNLKRVECSSIFAKTFAIVQNNQKKWYTVYRLGDDKRALKEDSEKADSSFYDTLYLPSTNRRVSIQGIEHTV